MPSVQRGADGQALVPGGGLNVRAAKWCLIEDLAVRDAVQRASTRHGEIFDRDLLMQLIEQMEEDFFETMLQGEGQVHVALRNLGMRPARLAKQLFHAIGEMARQSHRAVGQHLHALIAAERLEITQVELEAAILGRNDLANLIAISIFSVGSEAHDLAFIAILAVADELADHGVESCRASAEGTRGRALRSHCLRSAPSWWKRSLRNRRS